MVKLGVVLSFDILRIVSKTLSYNERNEDELPMTGCPRVYEVVRSYGARLTV